MQWFVVHTKPRQEQRALENLQRQGFAAWLPMLSVEKFRRGRLEKVTEPMFQAPDGEARAMIFINLLSRPQVVSVELSQLAPARG